MKYTEKVIDEKIQGKALITDHREGNIKKLEKEVVRKPIKKIARELKRKSKLPWIAGLRDPWTDFLTTPKRWFLPKAIDKSMERSVVSSML